MGDKIKRSKRLRNFYYGCMFIGLGLTGHGGNQYLANGEAPISKYLSNADEIEKVDNYEKKDKESKRNMVLGGLLAVGGLVGGLVQNSKKNKLEDNLLDGN